MSSSTLSIPRTGIAPSRKNLVGLDGLRGLAIVAVMLHHGVGVLPPNPVGPVLYLGWSVLAVRPRVLLRWLAAGKRRLYSGSFRGCPERFSNRCGAASSRNTPLRQGSVQRVIVTNSGRLNPSGITRPVFREAPHSTPSPNILRRSAARRSRTRNRPASKAAEGSRDARNGDRRTRRERDDGGE